MLSFKKSLGRAFLFLHIFLLAGVSAFALPKVNHYVPNNSGEYVYYRDFTFSEEAYIGFVCYSDSTYGARFYSPATSEQAERDISVYLEIDPAAEYMSFKGDSIHGMKTQEDADIVNYIYDVMIELTKFRQKVTVTGKNDTTQSARAELFNGDIRLCWNAVVPVFNLRNISKADGSFLWNLMTVGILRSSTDKGFSDFKGFSSTITDLNRNTKIKNAKKASVSFNDVSFTLDGNWSTAMDNLWLMGDYGMVMVSETTFPSNGEKDAWSIYCDRFLHYSSEDNYVTWHTRNVKTEGQLTVTSVLNVQPSTKDVLRSIHVTYDTGNGQKILVLSVFDSVYQKNKKYFDEIISSVKFK